MKRREFITCSAASDGRCFQLYAFIGSKYDDHAIPRSACRMLERRKRDDYAERFRVLGGDPRGKDHR
jgi:hypothetical protein